MSQMYIKQGQFEDQVHKGAVTDPPVEGLHIHRIYVSEGLPTVYSEEPDEDAQLYRTAKATKQTFQAGIR